MEGVVSTATRDKSGGCGLLQQPGIIVEGVVFKATKNKVEGVVFKAVCL